VSAEFTTTAERVGRMAVDASAPSEPAPVGQETAALSTELQGDVVEEGVEPPMP
jgi:hypothetical protein